MTAESKRYPKYRLLTGRDDAEFCERVSEALTLGYALYGDPALAHGGDGLCVAQAVVWDRDDELPVIPPPIISDEEVARAPYQLNTPHSMKQERSYDASDPNWF